MRGLADATSPVSSRSHHLRNECGDSLHRGGVGTDANSAPIHRLHMHRPERLCRAVAEVRADRKPLLLLLSQRSCWFFPALLAAKFRLIFRELRAVSSPASCFSQRQNVFSARRCSQQYLRIPRPLRRHVSTCNDHPRCALFWKCFGHRRISRAAEKPKWNDITRGEGVQDSNAYDGSTAGIDGKIKRVASLPELRS